MMRMQQKIRKYRDEETEKRIMLNNIVLVIDVCVL